MILTINFNYFDAVFGNFSEFLVFVGLECAFNWLKTSNSAHLSQFQKKNGQYRPRNFEMFNAAYPPSVHHCGMLKNSVR